MSIESSSVEQEVMSLKGIVIVQVSNRGCILFEGSREMCRASIKRRLFESSREGDHKGDFMVYFVRREDC